MPKLSLQFEIWRKKNSKLVYQIAAAVFFSGTSIGDCDLKELRSLLETLQIDLGKLHVKSRAFGNKTFPTVDRLGPIIEDSESLILNGGTPRRGVKRPLPNDSEDGGVDMAADDDGGGGDDNGGEDDDDEEVMQIAPEVQMFLGNHFLADNENGGDGGGGGSNGGRMEDKSDQGSDADNTSMMEQAMARHKEMARSQYQQHLENGGGSRSGGGVNSTTLANGLEALAQHQQMQQLAATMAARGGGGEEGSNYSCRLCGKVAGNGASLFAHLLYPHYAHLWRDDVPHRAAMVAASCCICWC